MIELIASAVLMMPTDGSDRALNLNRPSRGAHASAVREAATVPPRWVPFARCVLKRESGAVLHNKQSREDARNGTSSAAGRWQYLSAWQHGGSFMVRDRLVRFGVPKAQAKTVRQYLGSRPIYRWSGWYQDILFNEVIKRGGWTHWSGPGCNGLVP